VAGSFRDELYTEDFNNDDDEPEEQYNFVPAIKISRNNTGGSTGSI
jgi:hypothetical protein